MKQKEYYQYEPYLDKTKYISHTSLVDDYGLKIPPKKYYTLYTNDENLIKKYQSSNLVTFKTQNGSSTISQDLLLDLIKDNGLFKYMLLNLFNASAVLIEIRYVNKNNELDLNNYIRLKRVDVLTFFQQFNITSLPSISQMRIALLLSTSHRETLEKVYKDEELKREIDGKLYQYKATDLINIIFMNDEEYNRFIRFGDNKEVIAFFIVEFFEINRINEKYLLPSYVINRLNSLKIYESIDYESLNKCRTTNDEDEKGISIIDQFELHPDLENYLFHDVPAKYSKLEQAIYLYFKLCSILTYDGEYYASHEQVDLRREHENITELSNINTKNTQVINYEFILLYAKILNILGIKYTLSSGFGGDQGILLKFRYNEYILSINAIEITELNDLANVKYNEEVEGLKCLNESKVTSSSFKEILKRIQNEYYNKKSEEQAFEDSLEEYTELYVEDNMSDNTKLNFLLALIKENKLNGIEALEYINHIYHKILGSNFNINFISVKGDSYSPIVILTEESDEGYIYYQIKLDGNCSIENISKEALKEKFDTGEYAYIYRQEKIHGLNLQGSKNYVR